MKRKAQTNDDGVDESRQVRVTVLASEWGSSRRELSTINRDLAIQLAKFPEVEISFFLPKCSQEEKKVAHQEYNVHIVEAKPRLGFKQLDWLCFPPKDLKIDVVVGHGVELGKQANVIKEQTKCKCIQVVHTDPEELGMFKSYPSPISKGQEKHKTEVKLCEDADLVVGVGPKLSEAFRSYLRSCQKDESVLDFTPGVFEEFKTLQHVPTERKQRIVLLFGAGEVEDFELKGFDIAAKAVAALQDTRLMFVGAPNEKQEEIKEWLTGCGVPAIRLKVRGFVQDRESLFRLFQEVDLVVMPSRTEGFGLTGLEALSAGLPVLVSHNSGFGQALSKVPLGSLFVVDSEDPTVWTTAIEKSWAKDRKCRLEEAEYMRNSYDKKYNWAEQTKHLIDKITSWYHDDPSNTQSFPETNGKIFQSSFKASEWTEGVTEEHEEKKPVLEGIPSSAGVEEEELVKEAEDDVKALSVQATEVESQGVVTEESSGDAEVISVQAEEEFQAEYVDEIEPEDVESEEDIEEESDESGEVSEEGSEGAGANKRGFVVFRKLVTIEGTQWTLPLGAVHLMFPPNAVCESTSVEVRRWKYSVCLPPLQEHEAITSNIVELSSMDGQHLKFNTKVKLSLSHSATDLRGYELVIMRLIDKETNKWEDVDGTRDIRCHQEMKDHHSSHMEIPNSFFPIAQTDIIECSTYAVVCRLKSSPTYTITSNGGTFIHPDFPGVTVTIPENAVDPNAEFPLELKVQEVPSDEFQDEEVLIGPVLRINCREVVQFLRPVTIQLPISLRGQRDLLPDPTTCRVRVLFLKSDDKQKEWIEITDDLVGPASFNGELVKFHVKRFSGYSFFFDWSKLTSIVNILRITRFLNRLILCQPRPADFFAYFQPGSSTMLSLICCDGQLKQQVIQELKVDGIRPRHGSSKKNMIPGYDKAFVFVSGGIRPFDGKDMEDFYLQLREGNLLFDTALQVRVVDAKRQALVEFRNTFKPTKKNRSLCTLRLTIPVQNTDSTDFEELGQEPSGAVKEGSPARYELEGLSRKISDKWQSLGRQLGFDDAKLLDFDQKRKLSDKAYDMLIAWKERDASIATYLVLNNALRHEFVERRDLAEKFCCH